MTLSGLRRGLYRGGHVLGDVDAVRQSIRTGGSVDAAGAPAGPQGAVAGIRAGHAKGRAVMRCCDQYRELLEAVKTAQDKADFDSDLARLLGYVHETVRASFDHHIEEAGEAAWNDF